MWVESWLVLSEVCETLKQLGQFLSGFSLVPRPFPPPVFDHLQYANTEGEGLGDFVMCGYVR